MVFIALDTVAATKYADNVSWTLQQPVSCSALCFRSMEFAVGINNVRNQSDLNHLQLVINGATIVDYWIPEANYSTISQLITAMNLVLNVDSFTVSLNSNNLAVITQTQTHLPFAVVPTNFAVSILGYRSVPQPTSLYAPVSSYNQSNSVSCIASSPYNLSADTYVCLYITNLQCTRENNISTAGAINRCHFKIPVSAAYGQVYFFNSNTSFEQVIHTDATLPITQLKIQMTDRFGSSFLNAGSADFDWSLLVEAI